MEYGTGAAITKLLRLPLLTGGRSTFRRFYDWRTVSVSRTRLALVITGLILGTCTACAGSGRQGTRTLIVTLSGSGVVTSVPAGVNCGTDCTENYPRGTSVTLMAAAASGYHFNTWSGDCTGNAVTCTLTMSGARNVGVTFVAD